MKKSITLTITCLIIIFGAIFGYKLYENWEQAQKLANFAPAPATVSDAVVKSGTWQPYLVSVGTIIANKGVNIAPQVAGVVSEINFKSGQLIEKGQPILSLDSSVLKAQLESYTAAKRLAQVAYKRAKKLIAQKAISDSDFDTARSKYNQAKAQAHLAQAQLAQMTIYAPFSGKLGIKQITLGQYLAPGTTVTNLQSIEPVFVDFSIPSKNISQLTIGQPITVTVDSYPKKTFSGKITALDAQVSQSSRSIAVEATSPNTNKLLYPGLFANVHVLLPTEKKVVIIPSTAIAYTIYGDSVFVLTQKKTTQGKTVWIANNRTVQVGQTRNNEVEILSGLKSGEIVVTSGQLKLQNGSQVKINNTVELN